MDSFMYGKQGTGKAGKTTPKPIKKSPVKKTAAKKTAARPIDKSTWKLNTKVSQGTIDNIKSMGMTNALKMVKDYSNPSVKKNPGNREFLEGVRRLYGDQRFSAARGSVKKAAPSSTRVSPRNTEGRIASQKRPTSSKKSGLNTQTKIVRGIAGAGALALGGLALRKGVMPATMGAGAAKSLGKTIAKYSPKSMVPKVGTRLNPTKLNAIQARALTKAKAGKSLTPRQYQALKNAAKKSNKGEGIKKAKNAAKVKPGLNKKKTGAMAGASTTTLSGDTPKRR